MADPAQPLPHEDSIESGDPRNAKDAKPKSRRPGNTAFRQQRLKAWQPILTPKSVLPLFFIVGIIFAPIGGLLLWASSEVQEIMLDYTHCSSQAPESPILDLMPSNLVTAHFKKSNSSSPVKAMWSRKSINQTWAPGVVVPTIQCSLQFNIPSDMGPPVLFYYHLTNFFQNHRRYAKSFDADQLKGTARSASDIDGSDCKPLTTIDGKPIYPCGLAANSLFNDTFSNPILLTVPTDTGKSIDNQTYVMNNNSGIAWPSDKDLYGTTKYNWSQVAVPPNWALRFPNNYTDDNHPDLVNDEAFQVWMRLAGLPIFSKLAQRNDTDPMISGTYRVDINDNFNVTEYGGTKSILISTRTVMGGKNPFLGIAYVVVGGICVLLGTLFTVTHLIRPRKLGDHTYLSWNNEQPSSAIASGRDIPGRN